MLAKVSGHSNSDNETSDNNIKHSDCVTNSNMSTSSSNSNNNNNNFARVSLKTIKNKIKLNGSYSLTLLQNASSSTAANGSTTHATTTNGSHVIEGKHITNNNNNWMFSNDQDKIIYNSNSIDNNKSLIKSKSITACLNDDNDFVVSCTVTGETSDTIKQIPENSPSSNERRRHQMRCNKNKTNSISHQNENRFDGSIADDGDKGNGIIEDGNNEFSEQIASGNLNGNRSNDTNRMSMKGNGDDDKSVAFLMNDDEEQCDDPLVMERDDITKKYTQHPNPPTNATTISSSCSSTSNENNNEINLTKNDGQAIKSPHNSDELKLLNVNHKRNTNPFLKECNRTPDGEFTTTEATDELIENGVDCVASLCDANDRRECNESDRNENAADSKLNFRINPSMSWAEEFQNEKLINDDGDSDEFCNSEIFGAKELKRDSRRAQQKRISKSNNESMKSLQNTQSQKIKCNNANDPTSSHLITDNDPTFIIKCAIPTCSFQRQDYKRPGDDNEAIMDDVVTSDDPKKANKKLFKLSKKSGNLFNIPSFVKNNVKSTPMLKHVNLHYPDKTCISNDIDGQGDRRYFERFHSKAKYQLIKLGQKCKILTHQPPQSIAAHSTGTLPSRMGHVKTTIIKTNTNHRKKYQYYNEINKSYQLDDFIRSTHLLKGPIVDANETNHYEPDQDYDGDGRQCLNNDNHNNSVIYKSYKSEIDLTRNLTYLDAFLNEHFEHETTPTTMRTMNSEMDQLPISAKNQIASQHPKQQQQHKRVKSCSKNINYSTNAIRHDQKSTLINDVNFDGIDESVDDDFGGRQFYDGNVTSSSFEYTSVRDRKVRKDVQEIISGGRSNTTSSSLSSSDYASVYSGGSKDGRTHSNDITKVKLISTPEESIEYHDKSVTEKSSTSHKQKRIRSRRSSQPIPEHTNTYPDDESDKFLLLDQANFVELKSNMKKFHPDLYNSVPQFEDLNTGDYYETNPQYHPYDGETLINPYASDITPTNKRQLSSSYNDRSFHHQDYLEHYQRQQLLGHDGPEPISSDGYSMIYKNFRPRTSTTASIHSKHNEPARDVYYNQAGSANDLYDARKFPLKSHSQSIASYNHHPHHRVIVSKSKKQKGELVLEYEC